MSPVLSASEAPPVVPHLDGAYDLAIRQAQGKHFAEHHNPDEAVRAFPLDHRCVTFHPVEGVDYGARTGALIKVIVRSIHTGSQQVVEIPSHLLMPPSNLQSLIPNP